LEYHALALITRDYHLKPCHRICTHILAFEGDSQARLFLGNWSDYKERYGKSADVPQRIKYRTLKR
jgi:sulfate-transporting ATPase